ncbi:unnamed protein product [Adineta ricciae]|uniref:BPTI/Kunitz inhibitor domain-containing protein n=1 Tax=Adineta ricciae TaxID=249248 RepID=A0A813RPE1_ADIRI|nr:unnamed protein product [Adineta ricciae]CAF0797544.1 unnamed protein product [Adineta ricciae]
MIRIFSLLLVTSAFIYAIESATDHKPVAAGAKGCAPVKCHGKTKTCPYGYEKKNGCEICKCHDPCNPQGKSRVCGKKERCHVEKKPDGTFGTRCDAAAKKTGKSGKFDPKDCHLPSAVGPCRAAIPRFYYNTAAKTCEEFTYGGCLGNKNNFKSKSECERSCKQ